MEQTGYVQTRNLHKHFADVRAVDGVDLSIAEGELLNLTTEQNEHYTINYRLKDLESRLDPASFLRLGRGVLVHIDMIVRVNQMPGGTYLVTLKNNQQIKVSRLQSRSLRERLLRF